MTSSLIPNLFKSRGILLNILNKQGYDTSKFDNISINEFSNLYSTDNMDILLTKGKVKTFIRYKIKNKLKTNDIFEITDELFILDEILEANDNLIIITKDKINDTIKNILSDIFRNEKYFIVIFNISSLLFNILKHKTVPQHYVLSDKEIENFYKYNNIKSNKQIPTISRFDPVAKAILMRPGDICEIIRPSSTTITEKYYRVCL